jgi:hypothetical protein
MRSHSTHCATFVNVIIAFSLAVLSLFKDLRRPPGPEIFLAPFCSFRNTEQQWHMRRRGLAMRRSSLAPGGPLRLRSFITAHYSDAFDFCQDVFRNRGISCRKSERIQPRRHGRARPGHPRRGAAKTGFPLAQPSAKAYKRKGFSLRC